MSVLEALSHTLSPTEQVQFRRLLLQEGANNQGVDAQVYDHIRQGKSYHTDNKNAYHASRKRLTEKLIRFAHERQIETGTSPQAHITTYLAVAEHLMRHTKYHAARKLLLKSEKIAKKHQLYEQLNRIYLARITASDDETAVNDLLERYEKNKEAQQLEERMSVVLHLVERELRKVKSFGEHATFSNTVSNISQSLNMKGETLYNIRFAHGLLTMSRAVAKEKKVFTELKPFILNTYNKIIENQYITKTNYHYHLSILYMLCHTLYRVRDFTLLNQYLSDFDKHLNRYPTSISAPFQARYFFLQAQHLCLTGRLKEAIHMMEQPEISFNETDQIIYTLNLSLYYFMDEQYARAIRQNNTIGKTDHWLEKHMGREWVMKRLLMETLIHYDMGNVDVMESLIRSIQSRFGDLLQLRKYERVPAFIWFVQQKSASGVDLTRLEEALVTVPEQDEDLQAMAFYAWIKSKAVKKKYYTCLLEVIH